VTAATIHEQDILDFFDEQIVEGAQMESVVVLSAAFLDCTLGIWLSDDTGIAYAPDGQQVSPIAPTTSLTRQLARGGEVWLARSGHLLATDEFALGRFAVTTQALARTARPIAGIPNRTSPVQTLVDGSADGALISVALRKLGLRAADPIRVVIAAGPPTAWSRLARHLAERNRVVGRTRVNLRHVALISVEPDATVDICNVPTGLRVAQSRTFQAQYARDAYLNARMALHFALASRRDTGPYLPIEGVFPSGDSVGCFEVITTLPAEYISSIHDIKALDALVEEHGTDILRVLEAYAATESLRKAAAQVFMHHNTVAYWVHKSERVLGFQSDAPYRRSRLMLALCLRRVRENAEGL
jgi:hypothetical protein